MTSQGSPASPPAAKKEAHPIVDAVTGDSSVFARKNWPVWMQQLPKWSVKPPDDFQLIDQKGMDAVLSKFPADVQKHIRDDMAFLDRELLRYFRERDFDAAQQQNAYRLIQLLFIVLAFLATLIGSVQSLLMTNRPDLMPYFAFAETVVALFATYLATIAGREPPLPKWLMARRRAESLRREYFRYLMNMAPYDTVDGYERRTLLSQRAADINRGVFPDETTGNG